MSKEVDRSLDVGLKDEWHKNLIMWWSIGFMLAFIWHGELVLAAMMAVLSILAIIQIDYEAIVTIK